MTDTKMLIEVQVLAQYLGDIEMERFIALIQREPLTIPTGSSGLRTAKRSPSKPSAGRPWHSGRNITHDPRPTQPTGKPFMSFQVEQ
ncbi:MAG: hypothetical protein R3F44_16055 [Candidatus Competibacteraceae bacterium]